MIKKRLFLLFTIISIFITCLNISYIFFDKNISCLNNESLNEDSIENYEIEYINLILKEKISCLFEISNISVLYDFLKKPAYICVYDEILNWFAIIHRDSGEIFERANRESPYNKYINKKCYYGGVNSYFYEENGCIILINNPNIVVDKQLACNKFSIISQEIENELKIVGHFKSKKEINEYVNIRKSENNLVQLSSENRSNQTIADNILYQIGITEKVHIDQGRVCSYVRNGKTYHAGYTSFARYGSSEEYYDIVFPYNINGTCGTVAATALLQYYERNQIVKTVPTSFYSNSFQGFYPNIIITNDIDNVVTEKLHNALNARHSNGGTNSTYLSIKNTINKYFTDYGLTGVNAVCSAGWTSLQSCIDNGNPAIIFVSACTIYASSWDGDSYISEDVSIFSGHSMYTYGYTKTSLGSVDEYMCNAGWSDYGYGDYTWGVSFVSKTAIRGNVRLEE